MEAKQGIFLINDATSPCDLLNFKRYIGPLQQILTNPDTETPFTIGIFGSWGAGKSTLMDYLDNQLVACPDVEFFRVKFNPWIYKEEKNLIVPLLHAMQESFEQSTETRLIESAKKIGTVLARVGAALFLKTVTANQITLEDVEKQEKVYLDQYKRAKSELRGLRKELQEVVNRVTNGGQGPDGLKAGRIIFYIDDLDRCEPDQVIALLESVKLFLDLQYCFFIIALDEEVVQRAIQIKYEKYDFGSVRKAQIGREYLEKMIQLPLYLYPLTEDDVKEYIEGLGLPSAMRAQNDLFASILLPNPRKIKRILNLFLLNLGVLQDNPGLAKAIDRATLARLIALQVQEFELYAALLKHPDLPGYLGRLYQGKISTDSEAEWADLQERRKEVMQMCKDYHRPGTWLERLFKPPDAFPPAAELSRYFNMLGRQERK